IRLDDERERELLVVVRHADVFQIFGHAAAGNGCIQSLGVRQIAAALGSQPAFSRQTACDLSRPVGAKIEIDYRIIVADGRHGLALWPDADERHYELVRYTPVV